MTDAQRRILVDLSEGEWLNLVADRGHSIPSVATAAKHEYIRCDFAGSPFVARHWTITPMGIAALQAAQ